MFGLLRLLALQSDGAVVSSFCFIGILLGNNRIRGAARNVRWRNCGRNNRAGQTEMVVTYGAEQIVGRERRGRVSHHNCSGDA